MQVDSQGKLSLFSEGTSFIRHTEPVASWLASRDAAIVMTYE